MGTYSPVDMNAGGRVVVDARGTLLAKPAWPNAGCPKDGCPNKGCGMYEGPGTGGLKEGCPNDGSWKRGPCTTVDSAADALWPVLAVLAGDIEPELEPEGGFDWVLALRGCIARGDRDTV